jgi:hypothetical protein
MATTRTLTATKTFARIGLLKLQVSIALRRTTTLSDSALERLLKGVQNQWINRINVYGLDANRKARCQLIIQIDWQRHRVHIAAGRTTVSTGKGWPNDLAFELGDSVALFQEYVRENSLTTYWTTNHPDLGAKRDQVLKEMGLADADPVVWAGPKESVRFNVPELDELSVDLYLSG